MKFCRGKKEDIYALSNVDFCNLKWQIFRDLKKKKKSNQRKKGYELPTVKQVLTFGKKDMIKKSSH